MSRRFDSRSAGESSARKLEPRSVNPLQEVLELEILSVAYGGAGVARHEGKVVFVPFALPGERVRAQITRQHKRFSEARLVSVEVASPERIEPRCAYFGNCGGCAYQNVSYPTQLAWKKEQVRELYRRLGKLENPPLEDPVPSPEQWAYRNRIRVHVRDGVTGFYAKQGNRLVDVARCELAAPEVNARLSRLRAARAEPREHTLALRPGVQFFEQTNDGAARELLRLVAEMFGPEKDVLVDAYCGAGFFGHHFAGRFGRVVGIEQHERAVMEARRRSGPNEHYVCGEVSQHLPDVLSAAAGSRAVVLLDPPMTGLEPRVVDSLIAMPVDRLVYVSCDPATQARDVGELVRGGYRLERVAPLDMFPQTADVEVVALMVRAASGPAS